MSAKHFVNPSRRTRFPMLLLLLILAALIVFSVFLRSLSTELAVSMAQDAVVAAVNNIIKTRIGAAQSQYGELIPLEKDSQGNITAVTTNGLAIDELSSDLLLAVIDATEDHDITIEVPVGSLTGSTLLNSRGPCIKVKVRVLSSSFTGFHSELTSMGINQTKHSIVLELREELTLLMPWRTINTSVLTEIPIAETILLGEVPQTYFDLGE